MQLELLAPAGGLNQLKAAISHGANAVYFGTNTLNMRAAADGFTLENLADTVELAHENGVKTYLTLNATPHNEDLDGLETTIKTAVNAKIDAFIAADLGVIQAIKTHAPTATIHASVQMGVTNYMTANFLHDLGVKRIIVSRELTLEEIAEIRAKTPTSLEIEAFTHGAMCVSRSGRCLLSNYMTNRDANRGSCAQSCRWEYNLTEKTRPNAPLTIGEDEKGAYILNANDMCMINHLDKMHAAGITSFKLEGRTKSEYYVAIVTNAYRAALNILENSFEKFELPSWILNELEAISHRPYSTGFYLNKNHAIQNHESAGYIRKHQVVGQVLGFKNDLLHIIQRNRFFKGDELEVLQPGAGVKPLSLAVKTIFNKKMEEIPAANQSDTEIFLKTSPNALNIKTGAFLRGKLEK